jgi:hypothetical protein
MNNNLILKIFIMKIAIFFIFILSIINYACIGQTSIRRPLPTKSAGIAPAIPYDKPVYNVYLENSGSMNGYVQNQAEFQDAVGHFLNNIEIYKLARNINLNYINSIVIPLSSNIPEFIAGLNPTNFANAGGKIITTDICKMVESILSRTNDNCVSIFISDCVLSPESNVSAKKYLLTQELGITRNFANKLNTNQLTTAIMQLLAKFDGTYYDYLNQPTTINAMRPYYIWIIGKHEYIKELFDKVDRHNFSGGGAKWFYSLTNVPVDNNFSILNSPYFERDKKDPKHKIIKAEKIKNGPHAGTFQISFGINLKDALLDDDYILDGSKYDIPSNYSIEVKKSTLTNFTHILTLTTTSLKPQNLHIQLKDEFPKWIVNSNSSDDSNLRSGNEMNKTYGITHLIKGVYEAYLAKKGGPQKPIFEFEVSIN